MFPLGSKTWPQFAAMKSLAGWRRHAGGLAVTMHPLRMQMRLALWLAKIYGGQINFFPLTLAIYTSNFGRSYKAVVKWVIPT